jgi:hypothetical protein
MTRIFRIFAKHAAPQSEKVEKIAPKRIAKGPADNRQCVRPAQRPSPNAVSSSGTTDARPPKRLQELRKFLENPG